MPGGQNPGWGRLHIHLERQHHAKRHEGLSVPNNSGQLRVTYSITPHSAAITASNWTADANG
jgi:hypothetical protein